MREFIAMNQSELLVEIQNALQCEEPLLAEMLLGEVEEFDSLGLITVISLYDELFNVMLSETDFENMEQVSDLISPIYDKLSMG